MSVVVLLEPRSIPKTTSGKIQRHKCKNGYYNRTLKEIFRWEAAAGHPLSSPLEAQGRSGESESFYSAIAEPASMGLAPPAGAIQSKSLSAAGAPQHVDVDVESKAMPQEMDEVDQPVGQQDMGPVEMVLEDDKEDEDVIAPSPAEDVEAETAIFIERLITYVVQARKMPREAIDPDQPMSLLGFDSLGFVVLGRTMGDWVGKEISPAIVYKFTTIREVAGFLARGARDEELSLDGAEESLSPDLHSPIAVVGIGCRAPGGPEVGNLIGKDALWRFVVEGRSAVRDDMPYERKVDHNIKLPGNYLDGIDQFDHEFFGLGVQEAEHLDYHQAHVLETAWHALEVSRSTYASLANARGAYSPVMVLMNYHRMLESIP